jgi:hypothetical protein
MANHGKKTASNKEGEPLPGGGRKIKPGILSTVLKLGSIEYAIKIKKCVNYDIQPSIDHINNSVPLIFF